jgi:hypothetical protein
VKARPPYLAPVPDGQRAAGAARASCNAAAGLVADGLTAGRKVRVTGWQRMEIEQARQLLMGAGDLFASKPDAYVAGLIEGAASNLLDIIDAITEV